MDTQKSTVSAEEREAQTARFVDRWMPCLVAVPLIFVVVAVVGVFRHPGVSSLLRLIPPIGSTLFCLSSWARARSVLAGHPRIGVLLLGMLGLVMGTSGSTVSSAYRHGDMVQFLFFGGLLLTLSAICLAFCVLDMIGQRKSVRQERDSRPTDTPPSIHGIPADTR